MTIARIVTGIFGAYLFVLSIAISYFVSDSFIAPIRLIDINVANPVLKSGEDLRFTVKFERVKICKTDAERFLLRVQDGMVRSVAFREVIPGFLSLGRNNTEAKLRLSNAPDILAGSYRLEIYIISYCSLITRVDRYAPVEITIH